MKQNSPHIINETDNPEAIVRSLGVAAKNAANMIAQASTDQINQTLKDLAQALSAGADDIMAANKKDVAAAQDKNLTPALIDRLTLTPDRIKSIAQSVLDIAGLDDPVGIVLETFDRPNGLKIEKISVPIGVLGMIYESRPNVTIDAAALCLKSHNAVILRGGSESFHSSRALHQIVQQVLKNNNLPEASVSMVPSTDRAIVGAMLKAGDYIDVMIPRGGKGLTGRVMDEAKMPVFAHLDGNCHIFVHDSVKPDLAVEVIKNAKLRRTGICGAAESLLFDQNLDTDIAKQIVTTLLDQDCAVVGDAQAQKLDARITPATEEDWSTEYLDKKISLKYVAGVDEAIDHINAYGSHHTDAILAEETNAVQEFQKRVDSAIVMHNTSTQFADGGEFGFGAEIGIGTGKLHARGPVGVRQLTTFKYLVKGDGQLRP
ncbi:MAG TPA: glutamate-5-semialdehyde dehydrogenase [Alphaproteobacteria bacterium]|nr:glutamate-5-semialdehyde dehydrogenase [Alphaproteobacteria bacterium]